MANKKSTQRILKGIALRDSLKNTVMILVPGLKKDLLYQKRYRSGRKFLAHTASEIKKGQAVNISEVRPISKKKTWQVVESK